MATTAIKGQRFLLIGFLSNTKRCCEAQCENQNPDLCMIMFRLSECNRTNFKD